MPNIPIFPQSSVALFIIYIWSIAWKGFALWKAAKFNQRNWFIAILILSTAGILEIVYLFYFAKQRLTLLEVKSFLLRIFGKKAK